MTARVLKRQIRALERVSADEKIDRSAALRKVIDIGLSVDGGHRHDRDGAGPLLQVPTAGNR